MALFTLRKPLTILKRRKHRPNKMEISRCEGPPPPPPVNPAPPAPVPLVPPIAILPPPPPPAQVPNFQFPPIFFTLLVEYLRILLYGIPPTLIFICLEPWIQFPVYPAIPCPSFLLLSLFCILSCFYFGADDVDGYFNQPPTTFEKGVRLVAVKFLEVLAEYNAYRVFIAYEIREPFIGFQHSFEKNAMTGIGIYLLTVLAISAMRTFIIFPWIVLALRWTFKVPTYFLNSQGAAVQTFGELN